MKATITITAENPFIFKFKSAKVIAFGFSYISAIKGAKDLCGPLIQIEFFDELGVEVKFNDLKSPIIA